MNKDKQIEEMAKDIRLNMQIQPNPKEHPSHQLARLLVQDGYRKASDVAEEICAAADEIINTICVMTGIEITAVGGKYLELRNKYTQGNVVEVVRCKDCKFNVANMEIDENDGTDYSGKDIVCSYFMTDGLEPNDYCNRGKRREE